MNKRIAFVSGDVRVTDGVVSARVDEGDAVGMNTGVGVAMPVEVDGCSVVPSDFAVTLIFSREFLHVSHCRCMGPGLLGARGEGGAHLVVGAAAAGGGSGWWYMNKHRQTEPRICIR